MINQENVAQLKALGILAFEGRLPAILILLIVLLNTLGLIFCLFLPFNTQVAGILGDTDKIGLPVAAAISGVTSYIHKKESSVKP